MNRIVLDTNVLISGAHDDLSASWRIMEACARGEHTAIVSRALRSEYEKILPRAVRVRDAEQEIHAFLTAAETVEPLETPRVIPDDPDDDKVVAAAVAGRADVIITNDRHLLDLDPYTTGPQTIRILRPTTYENIRAAESPSAWQDVARNLGIGT